MSKKQGFCSVIRTDLFRTSEGSSDIKVEEIPQQIRTGR
jgi:hypothetical protein